MLKVAPSTVSWIGTVQIFTLLAVGTLSGRASDAGLVHESVLIGTFLIVFGMFVTSLDAWLVGAIVVLQSQETCSSGHRYVRCRIGRFGLPSNGPAIAETGFGWTLRSMAFVTLFLAVLINLLLRVRVPARKSGPIADLRAFTELPYIFFVVGFFLIYLSVYFAFRQIDLYGFTYASFTSLDSINLLLITNALGIPGRILPGFIAARFLGPLNTAIPTAVSVAIVLYFWPAVAHEHGALYAWAAVYGFVASAIQSLFAVSLAALTDDLSQIGTRMGMVFSVVAFASLTGSPIGGAIVQASGGNYLGAQLYAASSMLLGAGALTIARICKTGWVLKKKV
ncbi:MFS monocarboxylate transporter [Xylariaceae sp. FL1651]|nr:MFS monocarboxylate transporter [Xylariaceae sp. FL1651]